MKTLLFPFGVGCFLLAATPGLANTWSATCQGLNFKFNREEKTATVTMQTAKGGFVIATGPINFDNGTAVRAVLDGGSPNDTVKLSQVGLNRSRNIVYVLNRKGSGTEIRDSVFCDTAITVTP